MFERIKETSRKHYEEALARHGDSPQGVDWSGKASQELRFQILSEIADLNGRSVHEVGCGLGHFVDFLDANAIWCAYVGSDISAKMIERARQRLPQIQLYVADILDDDANTPPDWLRADYVMASGIFNVMLDNDRGVWHDFVEAMVTRMLDLADKGIAFNLLTSYVDCENPDLFYLPPGDMLDFCIHDMGHHVVIRHDYPLWEYTVYVYK